MFPLIFGHTFNDKEELEVEMKKIFLIIGRSGSGKDTVFRALKDRIKEKDLDINEVPIYTTRPMRPGEAEGEEYQFISEREFLKMEEAHEFVESRSYQTVFGIWRYGTALYNNDYVLVGCYDLPFVHRGGVWGSGAYAGVFAFVGDLGGAFNSYGFRPVVVV